MQTSNCDLDKKSILPYDQVNIKNNIIYFPLWRLKHGKYLLWSWEDRYLYLLKSNFWLHNCMCTGQITINNKYIKCDSCGAVRENEPSEEAVDLYMELENE